MSIPFTIAMIKSAAVKRGDEYSIVEEITRRGFLIAQYRRFKMCPTTAGAFYYKHKDAPYFEGLSESVTSYPVVAMVLTRKDDLDPVAQWRKELGSSKSSEAAVGTIRQKYGGHNYGSGIVTTASGHITYANNAAHGSQNQAEASYEWNLLFSQHFNHP